MTRQQVDRILKSYPQGRKAPSVWQTVALELRKGWSYGWAITFYDVWDRQVTCFGVAKAEATAHEHREAARYAAEDRKPAFRLAPALPELPLVAK